MVDTLRRKATTRTSRPPIRPSLAFGLPDQTLDIATLGKVLVWDRLPTVQMHVHVKSGMAVISMVPVHRLFADE